MDFRTVAAILMLIIAFNTCGSISTDEEIRDLKEAVEQLSTCMCPQGGDDASKL